jgi:hypothetical protein
MYDDTRSSTHISRMTKKAFLFLLFHFFQGCWHTMIVFSKETKLVNPMLVVFFLSKKKNVFDENTNNVLTALLTLVVRDSRLGQYGAAQGARHSASTSARIAARPNAIVGQCIWRLFHCHHSHLHPCCHFEISFSVHSHSNIKKNCNSC